MQSLSPYFRSTGIIQTTDAGVQLQQPGIQPEEMDGLGNDDVASDS